MVKISRDIFEYCIADAGAIKALALAIYIKNNFTASTVHGHDISVIANRLNIHQTVIYRSIKILKHLGLVNKIKSPKGKKMLIFKSLSYIDGDIIRIPKIKNLSYKKIVPTLRAMFIVDVQKRKNYVCQKAVNTINKLNNNNGRKSVMDKFKELKKDGLIEEVVDGQNNKTGKFKSNFKDNGISYSYICKNLGVGKSMVSTIIKIGEQLGFFIKNKNICFIEYKGQGHTMFAHHPKAIYSTKDRVYFPAANTYTLPKFSVD